MLLLQIRYARAEKDYCDCIFHMEGAFVVQVIENYLLWYSSRVVEGVTQGCTYVHAHSLPVKFLDCRLQQLVVDYG